MFVRVYYIQFNGKKTYTQAEIDEVRIEWMNFVIELDICGMNVRVYYIQFNGCKTYTQAEIDEVRAEWMNFVIELDI
ncbi:hypothetical protein RHMOL_Rhmol11G0016600 [Rhododendron molle]|uniref:Uncharacterized protein n=1 Tax=Rhododendron molle TaxID=49168 RepID=A0ACC0LML5_RHOML|nr:hypothetical protein RHMOL_Rhmol11G0016600 [Rhododendron molle]